MKLGTGSLKIQLCDDGGLMKYEYILIGIDYRSKSLPAPKFSDVTDTKAPIIIMDDGSMKKQLKGWKFSIVIPSKIIQDATSPDWETFIYRLWNWKQKIKVIPHIDELAYAYWVLLQKSRDWDTRMLNLAEIGDITFIGEDVLSTMP